MPFVPEPIQKIQKQIGELYLYAATHDTLTGALNRTGLEIAYTEIYDDPTVKPLALLLADGDHQKWVNKTFGFRRGDETIKGIYQTVRASVRRQDVIARIGGDEFLVLLLDDRSEMSDISRRRRYVSPGGKVNTVYERFGMATKAFVGQNPDLYPMFGISLGYTIWRHGVDFATLQAEAEAVLQIHKDLQESERSYLLSAA